MLKRLRLRVRTSSVFAMFLVSILFIMLVPISANLSVVLSSRLSLQRQINAASRDRFDSMARKTEEIFTGAYGLALRLSQAEEITAYLKNDARDYYAEYKLRVFLENAISMDSTVLMCYLYFPRYDYILYSGAGMRSHYFHAWQYGLAYEEWKGALRLETDSLVVRYWRASERGEFTRANVLKRVAYDAQAQAPVVVGVEISAKHLVEEMQRMGFDRESGVTLLSANGVVASTLPGEESAILYGRYMSGELDSEEAAPYTDVRALKKYGITLVHTVSGSVINRETRFFRYSVLYALLFGTALTVVLIVMFSRSQSRRIQRILSMLNTQNQPQGRANEYEAIEALVGSTMRRYSVLSETVASHAGELMAAFFQRVLRGEEKERIVIRETFRLYGHAFAQGALLVCVCQPAGPKKPGESGAQLSALRALLAEIDLTCLRAMTGYWAVVEGRVVGIISFDVPAQTLEAENMPTRCAARLTGAVIAGLGRPVLVRASGAFEDAQAICGAYEEAVRALQAEQDGDGTEDWAGKAEKIIAMQYMDQDLTASSIADQLSLSRPYLSQHYKRATGIGIHEALQRYRVERAKEIVVGHGVTLQEVAERTGFASAESLIRNFKKYVGCTPGVFREKER